MEEFHSSELVPKIMSLEYLKEITNNFSKERELGSGTFGKVYKGLQNGEEIAVKMLHLTLGHDDLNQFTSELENLRRLKHPNIVKLLGYCYERKIDLVEFGGRSVHAQNICRALCFEYIHGGSLQRHLYEEHCGHNWQIRYNIIMGICEGLKYLHKGLEIPVYHLNLKPNNILLDENMVPKITDFGLSRLVGFERTRATFSSIGTSGYLSPEYIDKNSVSDIFSLGVVMIKIITGHEGYRKSAEMPSEEFIDHVHKNWKNRLRAMLEVTSLNARPRAMLEGTYLDAACNQVKKCIEIALACVNDDPKKRPTTGEIIHALKKIESTATCVPHELRSDPGSHIGMASSSVSTFKDETRCETYISTAPSPQQASFGEQETSTWLKAEKQQPEPSSSGDRDPDKIAQDEDEHCGKKPSSKDLFEIISSNEDEQHSDKTGIHAIQDHKQGQGGAGGHVQSLLDMDDDTLLKEIADYFDQLKFDRPDNHVNGFEYTQQCTKLYLRLAFYRIRGYELAVARQLPRLDDAYLEEQYSSAYLLEKEYFKHYEQNLEWYFDPELCLNAYYDDYQRLMLCDYGEYRDWDCYHLIRNTYEQDLAYVQYCKDIANQTKWIDDFVVNRPIQWKKIENVALLQALKVAASVHNVPISLLCSGLREHIWSVKFDHLNCKGMDGVYFEIWKRVSKQNMDFTNALSEIHRQNMFPSRSLEIEHELKGKIHRFSMKDNYDAHVACINETVSEDHAELLIKEAVINMCPKSKAYVDYARKKLGIAKKIGLTPKGMQDAGSKQELTSFDM